MSKPIMTPRQRIQKTVEIGMVYLQNGSVEHKQFAIEAMLALMTDCDSVPAFRRRFRGPDNQWKDGTPL